MRDIDIKVIDFQTILDADTGYPESPETETCAIINLNEGISQAHVKSHIRVSAALLQCGGGSITICTCTHTGISHEAPSRKVWEIKTGEVDTPDIP